MCMRIQMSLSVSQTRCILAQAEMVAQWIYVKTSLRVTPRRRWRALVPFVTVTLALNQLTGLRSTML